MSKDAQSVRFHAHYRTLARCRLDVRVLGCDARCSSHGEPPVAEVEHRSPERYELGHDVPLRDRSVGILPCGEFSRCVEYHLCDGRGDGFALPAGGKFEELFDGLGISFAHFRVLGSLIKPIGILTILAVVLMKMKNPIEYAKHFRPNKTLLLITFVLLFISLYQMTQKTEFLYFQF